MKSGLIHLPLIKQQELVKIVELIRTQSEVEMLILFGSYARGDWREKLNEDGMHFIYQSDFDLLVIVETRSTSKQRRVEQEIKKAIDQAGTIHTPVSVIVHDLEYVNCRLTSAQYFFSDIQRQGIMLYDSGRFKLETARKLHPNDRYQLAKEDFENWFRNANEFWLGFKSALQNKTLNKAAFDLHQTAERLYTAILLVFTRYKPNTHSLETLRKLVNAIDPRFTKVFPLNSSNEKYYFILLCNAYVEARYKPSYAITEEELAWLSEQVNILMTLANELCQEKIAIFAQGGE